MSRNSGDDIKRKNLIKIQEGGTHGRAPLGYKNVGEGSKRWDVPDPETFELLRWCFVTYAPSEWNIERLLAEATARGLLSSGGPNTPRKPVGESYLNRILRKPYYKGVVVFNGVEYEGKHEPLVDPETWQRVQDVLASKRQGLKQREHRHYLKGTIYCGHCGSRLVVTYARGKLGKHYPYYLGVGRQQRRTTCMLKARPIQLVEDQLIEHYRNVQLSAEGIELTARAVLDELAEHRSETIRLRYWQKQRLTSLDAERMKLMQARYAGAVPLDLLKSEQARLTGEIDQLQAALKVTFASEQRLEANADGAVALLSNCHRAYEEMGDHERRLMNQAFFKKVCVTEEGVTSWEYEEPFASLMRRHRAPEPHLIVEYEANPQTEADDQFEDRTDQVLYIRSPGRWARAYSVAGLKQVTLAERGGFEPPDPVSQVNSLAVSPIRPLSHLSVAPS